ncbi:hypothetical protein BKA67DRAFT_516507 [Truncatella angustata]|uniref:Zn(2)-C6 fungal-type domain-containing protein n=1 Tax=Truncatella angustata TaxID=152316 RepID=A0A9P8ZY48_9PEZI|nr:uncharacterized protein BKA67DRAFT_516507 [Truncatella angustata]KAH6655656.1 hypothetical protein BKA67DRAFT_516507 [Truncatella angustata]KAH8200851.1 hypothetical protein TruAng_005010 [Truncatella angustata]
MSSSNKSRQPRLRASCDGCFLAKVKCSKARPICSRCLACGIECRYSPSSRSGKPKAENCGSSLNAHSQDIHELQHLVEDKNMGFAASIPAPEHLFRINTGWATPPNSTDGVMSRNSSISAGLSMMGVEDSPMHNGSPMSAPPETYANTIPWTPPADFTCAPFPESVQSLSGPHVRSHSIDMSMPLPMAWSDPNVPENTVYSQMQTPTSLTSNYFPSPSTTPTMRPNHNRHKSSPPIITGSGGSCTCFTLCLQSLQALHNASAPATPPFDLVLNLNRKAVEGCATMLACPKCMSRSGTHTAAMLLATVMGKITSFYQTASHTHFENGVMGMTATNLNGPFGVSLGAYQLNGEDGRWLELEILARELRKLEELYARFREVCGELSDDPEVSRAMIGYLGHNLGSTLEVLSHRKGGVSFA